MVYYYVKDRTFFNLDDARKFAIHGLKKKRRCEIDIGTAGGHTTIGEVYKFDDNDYRWSKYGVGQWAIDKDGKIIIRVL